MEQRSLAGTGKTPPDDIWSWSQNDLALAVANYERGDSREVSARILRRTSRAVGKVENFFGLTRVPRTGRAVAKGDTTA